jgi:hypothetical protein
LKKNKTDTTLEYIGCSAFELKEYLEKKFYKEMNWENHGIIWEIDHIKPVNMFNLENEEERKLAFHYTNLQPLFKTTDIAKQFGYNDIIGNKNKQRGNYGGKKG